MSFVSRIWAAIRTPRARFMGRDLQGNTFFELASGMDRPKRTVVYKNPDDMWDYVGGQKRLSIQWSAWLSHTRPNAPTTEELYADAQRQIRVKQNAALIEARDREEAENMKRLREETRAELLGAPSRPDTTTTQTHGSHPTQQAREGSLKGAAPSTSTNPWDAAKNAPETEAWAPQLRRRGS